MSLLFPALRPARLPRRALFLSLPLTVALTLPASFTATAQMGRPLTADPGRAPQARPAQAAAMQRTTALSLPFFDDFANDATGPQPNPTLWETAGGAYRNDRFALRPPSRGVVSFDGLNTYGVAYGSGIGNTDTLASQPIDLVGQSSVVLSFWWQRGGVGGNDLAPGTTSQLILEFDDGTGFWTNVWQRNGNGLTTAFQQAFVAVDPLYVSANFRFRFRSRGTRLSTDDLWSIDYVELDANRQPQPGSIRDAAFSKTLNSSLKPYTALPVWQFNAAASQPALFTDVLRTTLNNLNPDVNGIPTPLAVEGKFTVADEASGVSLATHNFFTTSLVLPTATLNQPVEAPFASALPSGAIPLSADYKTLTATLALVSGEQVPATRYNDTIRQTTALRDYYAYDDGTAEFALFLPGSVTAPGAAALSFDTNVPDQVAGVEVYLAGDLPTGLPLFVDVWADDGGKPAATPLIRQAFTVPPDSILRTLGRWWRVRLPTPVSVNGRFYAGYSQPLNSGIVTIGWDLSDSLSTSQYFFRARTDPWQLAAVKGAMIRPHMNNNGLLAAPKDLVSEPKIDVFPNPVSASEGAASVQLRGEFREAVLVDVLGRPVRTVPAGATSLSVRDLAPGVYLLQFRTAAGAVSTRRLAVGR